MTASRIVAPDNVVSRLWPDMEARLGDRLPAFMAAAASQSEGHGLVSREAAARYLNLCFAFGPAFEQRPENVWALATIADERQGQWSRMHRLVQRALLELARRGDDPGVLSQADAALIDVLDDERCLADPEAVPLPRVACDLETLELRLGDAPWRREYRVVEGLWQLQPVTAEASLRVDGSHPAPVRITLLSHDESSTDVAQLQARQTTHGGCSDRHPALRFLDPMGIREWGGNEARAVSWPVRAMAQPVAGNGLGMRLIEETSPAIHLLEAHTCGLRDQGVPVGKVLTQVWAYPSDQWLFVLSRDAAHRCRIERDGIRHDAQPFDIAFTEGLPDAAANGFDSLLKAWSALAAAPAMHATCELLEGHGGLTWGWKEASADMAALPVMRVVGDLDLSCTVDLKLEGEIEIDAARMAVRLAVHGSSRLQWSVRREAPERSLLEVMLPAVDRFSFPFEIEWNPVASNDGALISRCARCSGVLTGEAGLRPRPSGSGWQWFVRLAVEPVSVQVALHDPALGIMNRSLALLPAMPVLDWSAG